MPAPVIPMTYRAVTSGSRFRLRALAQAQISSRNMTQPAFSVHNSPPATRVQAARSSDAEDGAGSVPDNRVDVSAQPSREMGQRAAADQHEVRFVFLSRGSHD